MELCNRKIKSPSGKDVDTMNILFDTINDLVYVMAASGSNFEMKVINLDGSMTRKAKIVP